MEQRVHEGRREFESSVAAGVDVEPAAGDVLGDHAAAAKALADLGPKAPITKPDAAAASALVDAAWRDSKRSTSARSCWRRRVATSACSSIRLRVASVRGTWTVQKSALRSTSSISHISTPMRSAMASSSRWYRSGSLRFIALSCSAVGAMAPQRKAPRDPWLRGAGRGGPTAAWPYMLCG